MGGFIDGFIDGFKVLLQNFQYIEWQMVVMWLIGGVLIYLAIAKEMEPTLLLPMGFGAILMNLPAEIVAVVTDANGVEVGRFLASNLILSK